MFCHLSAYLPSSFSFSSKIVYAEKRTLRLTVRYEGVKMFDVRRCLVVRAWDL